MTWREMTLSSMEDSTPTVHFIRLIGSLAGPFILMIFDVSKKTNYLSKFFDHNDEIKIEMKYLTKRLNKYFNKTIYNHFEAKYAPLNFCTVI